MSARAAMKHRAAVSRPVAATTADTSRLDPFGGPGDPFNRPTTEVEDLHQALPCYVQARTERSVARDGRLYEATDYLMLAPAGSDIEEGDRIDSVSNLRGTVLFGGLLTVRTLVSREGHFEASLVEVS